MYKTLLLTLTACALACTLPTAALAAKGDKKKANAAAGAPAGDKAKTKEERKELKAIFTRYDKNNNEVLDADEKDALKKDFATDASLKVLDKNSDGQLSDEEIAVLHAPKNAKKKNK